MIEEFIPYEEALALKDLGFDKPCIGSRYGDTEKRDKIYLATPQEEGDVAVPLWQQAFKWIRDNYGYYTSNMKSTSKTKGWIGVIRKEEDYMYETYTDEFKVPEEAELATLKELIKLLQLNK